MLRIAAILCFVSFAAVVQAGDSIKLLHSDIHAESLITFLESKEVESIDASPFVEFPYSDELLVALLKYAGQMEATVYQKREAVWNAANAEVERDLAVLQTAKIRHQLVMNAIKQMRPRFSEEPTVAESPLEDDTLVAGLSSDVE